MPKLWPILDASAWTLAGIEQQGRHKHEWYRHPSQNRTWLFKPSRTERHRAFGEDVAEKLASEFARLVGVPAARVELAERAGVHGALVEDVRPHNWALHHGQTLLSGAIDQYDPTDHDQRGHSPQAIRTALESFAVPPASRLPLSFDAFDAFAGYLVFDAMIAHGDRHDRNWAVRVPAPGDASSNTLCASFDHAASLGLTLSETACARHLREHTVLRWAQGGRAGRFEHVQGTPWQSLIDLAGSAARLAGDATRNHWRDRVLSVDRASVTDIVVAAPIGAQTTREFIVELVMTNQRRLLDELA